AGAVDALVLREAAVGVDGALRHPAPVGLADALVAEVGRVRAVLVRGAVRVAGRVDAREVGAAVLVEEAGERRRHVLPAEAVLAGVAGAAVGVGGAGLVAQPGAERVRPADAAAALAVLVARVLGQDRARHLAGAVAAGLARRALDVGLAAGRRRRRRGLAGVARRVADHVQLRAVAVLVALRGLDAVAAVAVAALHALRVVAAGRRDADGARRVAAPTGVAVLVAAAGPGRHADAAALVAEALGAVGVLLARLAGRAGLHAGRARVADEPLGAAGVGVAVVAGRAGPAGAVLSRRAVPVDPTGRPVARHAPPLVAVVAARAVAVGVAVVVPVLPELAAGRREDQHRYEDLPHGAHPMHEGSHS